MNNTVVLFGTFDGLHEGHRFLLQKARQYGKKVVVAVAQDKVVELLKKETPRFPLEKRMEALQKENLVDVVVPGDTALGSWTTLKTYQPECVVVGYDQEKLRQALEAEKKNLPFLKEIVVIEAFEPERYHCQTLFPRKSGSAEP